MLEAAGSTELIRFCLLFAFYFTQKHARVQCLLFLRVKCKMRFSL